MWNRKARMSRRYLRNTPNSKVSMVQKVSFQETKAGDNYNYKSSGHAITTMRIEVSFHLRLTRGYVLEVNPSATT